LARIRKLGEVGNGDGALKLAKANLEPKGSLGGLDPSEQTNNKGCRNASNHRLTMALMTSPASQQQADLAGERHRSCKRI
jgi:hypothetical protein